MAFLWILVVLVFGNVKLNAANKYRLAVFAQILGCLWFAFTLQFYYLQCSDALKQSNEFMSHQHFNVMLPYAGSNLQSSCLNFMLNAERLLPYLSAAYLLLLGFLIFKWAIGYQQAQSIRHKGLHKIQVDWKIFVKQVSYQLGIKKNVTIYLSELVTTPMTIGFLKPIILVPLASINHLSAEQIEAVLLHELAHIKRLDYLFNLFLSVAETILFFNPFSQLISKTIKKERKNSCDDWVLQFKYNPSMYAEALLRIAYLQTSSSFAMPFVGKNKGDLLSRTKRMIDNKNAGFNYRHQLLALLLMTGMLRSIAWLQPLTHKQFHAVNALETKKQKTFVQLPMLVDISNPFFNPMFFLQKPLRKEIAKALENAKKEIITAENDDKIATKNLASNIAVTAKVLEDIDWNEMGNDVEKHIKIADSTMNALPPIMLDTLCYKDIFKQHLAANMGEQKKGWQQLNLELKKIGAELEKAFKEKNLLKILEWQKHQSQINKAFTQLKNSKLPFLFNFSIPKINVLFKQKHAAAEETNNYTMQRNIYTNTYKANIKSHLETNPKKVDQPYPSITYTTNELSNEFPVTYTANNIAAMDANDANIYNAENYNEELEKATAPNINITTSVYPNFKDKKTKPSKRYEIVVTAKNGEEKKIVVIIQED